MKKEWILMLGVISVTVIVSIGMIRWLAPELLGGPSDLQLVQLDEKVPAYYKGIFRDEHFSDGEILLLDPLTRIRMRPFYPPINNRGPHDILGFRNSGVPIVADIITIGDSMTYGNNAVMEQNWPGYMRNYIGRDDVNIYNMSVGGWAAVQYLDMFYNAKIFRPRVVIVAFYTGNDSLDTFQMVYGNEHWHWLKSNDALSKSDSPKVWTFPPPESEWWDVTFGDGVHTVFTPHYRLTSNMDHPAVIAGYEIMARVAKQIGEMAKQSGITLVFTIIPTKELVYEKKVEAEGIQAPEEYTTLTTKEKQNINKLKNSIKEIPEAIYIDVLAPLKNAALKGDILYLETINGHPVAEGYEVIGKTIAGSINTLIPDSPCGLFALFDDDAYQILLANGDGVWYFNSDEMIEKNGWPDQSLPTIAVRDIVKLQNHGVVKTVYKEKFGPGSCLR